MQTTDHDIAVRPDGRFVYVLARQADADRILAWKRRTWTEFPGVGSGQTQQVTADHPVGALLAGIVHDPDFTPDMTVKGPDDTIIASGYCLGMTNDGRHYRIGG